MTACVSSWMEQGDRAKRASNRRVALLLNCNARRVDAACIQEMRDLVGAEHVYASRSLAEAEAMARQIVHAEYDVVACGGGDGTLASSINRILRYVAEANAWRAQARAHGQRPRAALHAPTFAFIALGTGNAVGHVVHSRSPTEDLRHLCEADALSLLRLPLIVGEDGQRFLFGGLGYDSLVLHDYNALIAAYGYDWLRSLWGYAAAVMARTLPRVVRGESAIQTQVHSVGRAWYIDPCNNDKPIALGADVPLFDGEADLLAIGTIGYFGYGMRAFPFAGALPDTMNLRIASMSAARTLAHLPQIWRGTLRDPARLRDWAVEGVRLSFATPYPFEHSGDDQGTVQQMTLRISPQKLSLVQFGAEAGKHAAIGQAS